MFFIRRPFAVLYLRCSGYPRVQFAFFPLVHFMSHRSAAISL